MIEEDAVRRARHRLAIAEYVVRNADARLKVVVVEAERPW